MHVNVMWHKWAQKRHAPCSIRNATCLAVHIFMKASPCPVVDDAPDLLSAYPPLPDACTHGIGATGVLGMRRQNQCSAVFTCIGALGTPSRTGPLARKYLPGFPYGWSLRRLRQKINSIYWHCNYPSTAQEQPFTVSLFRITKTVKLTRYTLLVFVQSCSSINNNIISLKNLFHHSQLGAPQKAKKSGSPGHVPSVPIG